MIMGQENTSLREKAMQSCKNYPQDNPVVVLFAYSKLLAMGEDSKPDDLIFESIGLSADPSGDDNDEDIEKDQLTLDDKTA